MASFLVGLTGGLASGKSVVARRLAQAGFTVVDADRLVEDLYRPGEPGARAVATLFGLRLLLPDGAADKAALAALVFSDPAARMRLESTIHPLVRHRFAELAARVDGVAVLEATLLAEAGHAPDFDLVVSIEAPPGVRLERAIARGLGESEARARLTAQGDGAARFAIAHVLLENGGSEFELAADVDRLIEQIRTLAADTTRPG